MITVLLAVLGVLATFVAAVPLITGLIWLSLRLADRGPVPTAWIADVEAYVHANDARG